MSLCYLFNPNDKLNLRFNLIYEFYYFFNIVVKILLVKVKFKVIKK